MVSVIIPTYKRSEFIERAIESVLKQTYQDFEIIVVDDNNPNTEYREELEEKMKQYANNPKIRYIQHEKNKNGAAARNTGINIAKGEYITFLDDDDIFLPNRLEILVEKLEKNQEYDAAYSSVIIIKGHKIIGYTVANKSGNMKNELLLGTFSLGTGSNLFFRASALRAINGFDESFKRHQDIEVMVRYFNRYNIIAIDKPLVVKVEDDRSNEPDVNKYIGVKEHFFEIFNKEIKELGNLKDTFYKNQYMMILRLAVKSKDKINEKKLKNIINKYSKITFKENIKLLLYKINNYVPLQKLKYSSISRRTIKLLDKNAIKEINELI